MKKMQTNGKVHQDLKDLLWAAKSEKRLAFIPDIHLPDTNFHVFQLTIQLLKRYQPDLVILGGDNFDFGQYSSFSDTRPFGYKHFESSIDIGLNSFGKLINCIQSACPNAVIVSLEGNHEYRIIKSYIDMMDSDKDTAYRYFVSGIQSLGVAYFNKYNLEDGHWLRINNHLIVGHGYGSRFETLSNQLVSSRKGLSSWLDFSVLVGHFHQFKSIAFPHKKGRFEHHAIGCQANQEPHYSGFGGLKGYQNGIAIVDFETGGNYELIHPIVYVHRDNHIQAMSGIHVESTIRLDEPLLQPLRDIHDLIHIEEQFSWAYRPTHFDKPEQLNECHQSVTDAPNFNSDSLRDALGTLKSEALNWGNYGRASTYANDFMNHERVFVIDGVMIHEVIPESSYSLVMGWHTKQLPRVNVSENTASRIEWFRTLAATLRDNKYLVIRVGQKGLLHAWVIDLMG